MGVQLIGGWGGGSGAAASVDTLEGASATGKELMATSGASAARATISRRTPALSTLTATNGLGTANAAAGTTAYADNQTAGSWADMPRLIGAHGGSLTGLDVAVRISMTGSPSVDTLASLGVGTDGVAYVALATLRVYGNGRIDAINAAGAFLFKKYTNGTLPVDGTGWLRARFDGGILSLWTGVGASYAAAVWSLWYRGLLPGAEGGDTAVPVVLSSYPSVALSLYQGSDPGPSGVTATWANLTYLDLV